MPVRIQTLLRAVHNNMKFFRAMLYRLSDCKMTTYGNRELTVALIKYNLRTVGNAGCVTKRQDGRHQFCNIGRPAFTGLLHVCQYVGQYWQPWLLSSVGRAAR